MTEEQQTQTLQEESMSGNDFADRTQKASILMTVKTLLGKLFCWEMGYHDWEEVESEDIPMYLFPDDEDHQYQVSIPTKYRCKTCGRTQDATIKTVDDELRTSDPNSAGRH